MRKIEQQEKQQQESIDAYNKLMNEREEEKRQKERESERKGVVTYVAL